VKVYFDNAATTRVSSEVLAAMRPFYTQKYGNPSSLHSFGREARTAVASSRESIAKSLRCDSEEIVFTSCGTEADNLALRALPKGMRLITSSIEHPAVFNSCKRLEEAGVGVDYLPVNREGIIDLAVFEKSLSKGVGLASIMHANNEIGSIQPINEIAELCSGRGVIFHSDAVQSLGKLEINLSKWPVDLLSLSAHKVHGPKGVGALFMRKGTKVKPLLCGGGHERGLRSGTENVPGIVGFAKAVELATNNRVKNESCIGKIRDKLVRGVLNSCGGAWLNGPKKNRLYNNAHFGFKGIEGESLVLRLDAEGIAASTGSACSSTSLKPSRVLLAIGLTPVQAHGSLRMTLSKFNTEKEVDYTIRKVNGAVSSLREITCVE